MDFLVDFIIEGVGAALGELLEGLTASKKKPWRIVGFTLLGTMAAGVILLIVFFGPFVFGRPDGNQ